MNAASSVRIRTGVGRGLQRVVSPLRGDDEMDDDDFEQPVAVPIDGCLDLHTFAPRELGELVPAYLEACREEGIAEVRLVHGKGVGNLRRSVHAILQRLPWVLEFHLAGSDRGAWGATIVLLEVTKR